MLIVDVVFLFNGVDIVSEVCVCAGAQWRKCGGKEKGNSNEEMERGWVIKKIGVRPCQASGGW